MLIWPVKNSTTRRAAFGVGANSGAGISDEAGEGTILEVGPATDVLPRHAGAEVVRVRGAVLPGLVNAHTHLELSAMRGKVSGGRGFVGWVESLIATWLAWFSWEALAVPTSACWSTICTSWLSRSAR